MTSEVWPRDTVFNGQLRLASHISFLRQVKMAHPVGLLRHQVAFEADQVGGCLRHLRCRQLQRRRIVLQGQGTMRLCSAWHTALANARCTWLNTRTFHPHTCPNGIRWDGHGMPYSASWSAGLGTPVMRTSMDDSGRRSLISASAAMP